MLRGKIVGETERAEMMIATMTKRERLADITILIAGEKRGPVENIWHIDTIMRSINASV